MNHIAMFNLGRIYMLIHCLTLSVHVYSASSAPEQTKANPSCQQGWSYMAKSNKCLKVFGTKPPDDPPLTWSKAEELCNQFYGGHLAALKSEEEITFVVELTHATGYDDGNVASIFIGLVFNGASGWGYPDGTTFTYVRWWAGGYLDDGLYNGNYPSGIMFTRKTDIGYMFVNHYAEGNNYAVPFVCQAPPSSEGG